MQLKPLKAETMALVVPSAEAVALLRTAEAYFLPSTAAVLCNTDSVSDLAGDILQPLGLPESLHVERRTFKNDC